MRTVSGMMLAVVVGLAAGCGVNPGSDSGSGSAGGSQKADKTAAAGAGTNEAPPPGPSTAKTDPPGTIDIPMAKADPQPAAPPAPVAGWEMDPARQVIPTTPVAGKLGGQPVTPEVSFIDQTLAFRMAPEGMPVRTVEVALPPEWFRAPTPGLKLVRPDQKEGPDAPRVSVRVEPAAPPGQPLPVAQVTEYPNGFALSLELRKDKTRYVGRIALSLPDEAKSYLAGEFAVARLRPPAELPGPDDAPFVQGKLTVAGPKGGTVTAGYVGSAADAQLAQGQIDVSFAATDALAYTEVEGRASSAVGPTKATPTGRYEHTRLPPGRYLVFGWVKGDTGGRGPVTYKWVTLEPTSQLALDLTVEAATDKTGKVEVKLPAGYTGPVRLAPADEPAKPLTTGLFLAVSLVLGLEEKGDGKPAVTFENLTPGFYEVRLGDAAERGAVVEVKAGETAKAEPKK